jgi:hypothetical protein
MTARARATLTKIAVCARGPIFLRASSFKTVMCLSRMTFS